MMLFVKYIVPFLVATLIFVFHTVPVQSQSSCTVEVDQDGTTGLFQAYDNFLNEMAENLNQIGFAVKNAQSLQSFPTVLNPNTTSMSAVNAIRGLLFQIYHFISSQYDLSSVTVGYNDSTLYSYIPSNQFRYSGDSSTALVYGVDEDTGMVKTDNVINTETDYDTTAQAFYTLGASNCDTDVSNYIACSIGWSDPIVTSNSAGGYGVSQYLSLGLPSYQGDVDYPCDQVGFYLNGKAYGPGNTFLGVASISVGSFQPLQELLVDTVSTGSATLAYVMTKMDGILLMTSDGSDVYKCSDTSASDGCGTVETITAMESSTLLLSSTAKFIMENYFKSDDTHLQTVEAVQYVVTTRQLTKNNLQWLIVVVQNYDAAYTDCNVQLENTDLSSANVDLNILMTKAVQAGEYIKGALNNNEYGVISNENGSALHVQAFENINNYTVMTQQQYILTVLQAYPQLALAYIGFPDKSFIGYIQSTSEGVTGTIDTFMYNMNTSSNDIPNSVSYRNDYRTNPGSGFALLTAVQSANAYDPTARPWYVKASDEKKAVFSSLYPFASEHLGIGITYAVPVYDNNGNLACVIGIDLILGNFNQYLAAYAAPGKVLYLMETQDEDAYDMIAASNGAQLSLNGAQTKAYNADQVLDAYIASSASYLQRNSITTDGAFVTSNMTISVQNYNNYGLKWRLVEVIYTGFINSGEDGTNEVNNTTVVNNYNYDTNDYYNYNGNDDENDTNILGVASTNLAFTLFTFVPMVYMAYMMKQLSDTQRIMASRGDHSVSMNPMQK